MVFAGWVEGGARSASTGNNVSEGFSPGQLPLDFIEAWQVGEESGKLEDVTLRLADNAGEQAELLFTELAKWLPRVVYFFICLWMVVKIFQGFSLIWGATTGMPL